MLTALGVLAAVFPFILIGALLELVTRSQRARLAAAVRQVAVTDAIHRELGAVVAPVVRRGRWGRWQLLIAVPFERPDTVARVLEVAYQAFAPSERTPPGRFEIVLSPQEKPVPRRDHAAVSACRSRILGPPAPTPLATDQ